MTVLATNRTRDVESRSFTKRYDVGAQPQELESDDETGGDVVKVNDTQNVQIPRTPNTETHVVPSSFVKWRGEQWRVRTRTEVNNRTSYDLVLERTS